MSRGVSDSPHSLLRPFAMKKMVTPCVLPGITWTFKDKVVMGTARPSHSPAAPRQSTRKLATGTRHAARTELHRGHVTPGVTLSGSCFPYCTAHPNISSLTLPGSRNPTNSSHHSSGNPVSLLVGFCLLWDFLFLIYSFSLFCFPSLHLEHKYRPVCLFHTRKRRAPSGEKLADG